MTDAAPGVSGEAPHSLTVTVTVTVDGRRHHVHCALVTPAHVVAWTTSAPPPKESAQ